eukprot:4599104-Pleurochrysis_carterae.AAC.1
MCASNLSLAVSCVAFGVGAPKVHWSKKMRPTPAAWPPVARGRRAWTCPRVHFCFRWRIEIWLLATLAIRTRSFRFACARR